MTPVGMFNIISELASFAEHRLYRELSDPTWYKPVPRPPNPASLDDSGDRRDAAAKPLEGGRVELTPSKDGFHAPRDERGYQGV